MNIDERTRHALHERLDVVLGQEEAVTLMAHLPPVGWADVATKSDIDNLAAATKHELDVLANQVRAELHKQIGSVRGEIGSVRGEIGSVRGEIGSVRGEIGSFREELHKEIGSVRAELHKEIGSVHKSMNRQTLTFVLSLTGSNATLAALAFAAARLV